jgi:uncharacterized membrane protein YfcA
MARSMQMMFSMAWSVLVLVAHGEWLGTVLSGLLTCAGVFMSGQLGRHYVVAVYPHVLQVIMVSPVRTSCRP